MTSGALAISVASPTDLVKVRLQGQGILPLADRPYTSSMDCYKKIIAKDSIKGLWVGWGPNVLRNSIIAAAELATYDQFKQIFLQIGMPDNIAMHVSCGFGAGFVACIVGSPVDVIKTRVMNIPPGTKQTPLGLVASMIS